MMGNEGSQLPGLEIDENAVETTDSWILYHAFFTADSSPQLSVFISHPTAVRKTGVSLLEKASKNLMLHRHPCILKFISSWNKQGRTYLATEEVKPLAQVIANQSTIQLCVGLHSILKALVFLHEKALSSHNNVCFAAVYVTPEGIWKLGGLEHLCRFSELTVSYLEERKARRYDKGIAPEEDSSKAGNISEPTAIDKFAFGVLVEEVLHKKSSDMVPSLNEFREICKKQLQNEEPSVRPKLSDLLDHPFFTHKFIKIHSFLEELPLKSEHEKQQFFRTLCGELASLPEDLVAAQLSSLLLGRLVLLDSTAQLSLLPHILCPRKEGEGGSHGLFAATPFRRHLVPRLLQMFRVRDAQVRLVLLTHFSKFCRVFSTEELKEQILPELLVGIKDTNDQVVSVTLRALAELVPVLGSATVIGGQRAKLFTDGRPKVQQKLTLTQSRPVRSPSRSKFPSPQHQPATALLDTESVTSDGVSVELPERPSPDGGEDHATTTDEEAEAWSDWDVQDAPESVDVTEESSIQHSSEVGEVMDLPESHSNSPSSTSTAKAAMLPDISSLDIKISENSVTKQEEVNFFEDMEPVISKTHVLEVTRSHRSKTNMSFESGTKSKFDVNLGSSESWVQEGEGWGDGLEDWEEDSAPEDDSNVNMSHLTGS